MTGSATLPDDAIWRALADPTRRRLLDLLRRAPRTTGTLAAEFPRVTRYAVMKHLRVLTEAGLVMVVRRGRERWNHLNAVPLRRLSLRWLEPFATRRADALLNLASVAEALPPDEDPPMTDLPLSSLDFALEIGIAASRAEVWRALVEETGRWWPADFYTGPGGRDFVIEPRLGGKVVEHWGDGQGLVWGEVLGIRTQEMLLLCGDSGPEFGGPSRGFHRFELTEVEGGMRLTFRESGFGVLSQKTADSLRDGWRYLIEGCLKPFVETGEQPARPETVEV